MNNLQDMFKKAENNVQERLEGLPSIRKLQRDFKTDVKHRRTSI
ncbi:hypothetical protein ABLV94_13440 [Staphylococcus sp. Mo2-7]